MTAYNQKLYILVAIALTVVALYSYRFIPEKRYLATADVEAQTFVFASNLPNGESAVSWISREDRSFRCVYPENAPDYSYYCSFNIGYPFGENRGINLSGYSRINLSIEYNGDAPKLRFFARNYSNKYSNMDDQNSSKYNAIFIATKDLKQEITLKLSDFVVTEWWLMAYGVPREYSHPELDNISNLGIDFSDSMTGGNHDVTVRKIEFVGLWISREKWYLTITCIWLTGVFIYTVTTLMITRRQRMRDRKTIESLHNSNQHLVKESDRFRKLSTVDALTQTYNRFGIDQIISALINSEKHKATGKPAFSLLLIDIDHFKRINDQRGHDTGDSVLKTVATLMQENIRECDYIGRWGGEEFVAVLPTTYAVDAMELAERLRMSVNRWEFEPENPLLVSVSIGVGSLHPEESFSDIFKRVDEALYNAKNAGRNCCLYAENEIML